MCLLLLALDVVPGRPLLLLGKLRRRLAHRCKRIRPIVTCLPPPHISSSSVITAVTLVIPNVEVTFQPTTITVTIIIATIVVVVAVLDNLQREVDYFVIY